MHYFIKRKNFLTLFVIASFLVPQKSHSYDTFSSITCGFALGYIQPFFEQLILQDQNKTNRSLFHRILLRIPNTIILNDIVQDSETAKTIPELKNALLAYFTWSIGYVASQYRIHHARKTQPAKPLPCTDAQTVTA